MKKLFVVLMLSVFALSGAQAQVTPVADNGPYCEVRMVGKPFSSKTEASIDFGKGEEMLKDDKGKSIRFSSPVDALNYLNTQGWELVDTHIKIYSGDSYTYYVMKRKL